MLIFGCHILWRRFQINIIAMHLKFNRAACLAITIGAISAPMALWSPTARAEQLPLIAPEATFSALGRITGDTLNQRLMDHHSTVRIQLADPTARLQPNTPLLVFRQGLRLNAPDGRVLGVLAVPVARGQTLSANSEADEIAQPNQPGIAWMRLQSLQQEVMRGDSVMTRTEAQTYASTDCKTSNADTEPRASQVLAIISQADMISSAGDLLAASGGCASGLNNGSTVSLWRPAVTTHGRKLDNPIDDTRNDSASVFDDNPAITRTQTPSHRVGTASVVATYPDVAILRIQKTSQPAQPGDLVRLSPTKHTP